MAELKGNQKESKEKRASNKCCKDFFGLLPVQKIKLDIQYQLRGQGTPFSSLRLLGISKMGQNNLMFSLSYVSSLDLYLKMSFKWQKTVSYTQKLLQKSFGSINVDVGDAAVSAQHAVHRGGNLPPVVLGVGVEGGLISCDVTHPANSSRSQRVAHGKIPPSYFNRVCYSCFYLLFPKTIRTIKLM